MSSEDIQFIRLQNELQSTAVYLNQLVIDSVSDTNMDFPTEKAIYPKDVDRKRANCKRAFQKEREKFTSSPPSIFTVLQDCNQGGEYLRMYWPVDEQDLDGRWYEWVPWNWVDVTPKRSLLKDLTTGTVVTVKDCRYSATVQSKYLVRFDKIQSDPAGPEEKPKIEGKRYALDLLLQ